MRIRHSVLGTFLLLGTLTLMMGESGFGNGQTPIAPAATTRLVFDKQRFAEQIRYAEAFTSAVTITVDDPTPSAYPGYSRVVVHLSAGKTNLSDKIYYLTADGKSFVSGSIWEVGQTPFHEALNSLPKNLPSMGPVHAPKVTIVVFSDFQCPYCRTLAQTIRQNIPKSFPNDVAVLFADFPLESKHPWAEAAAEAGHCISGGNGNNEAFWAFHDWIFEHQEQVDTEGKNLREKLMEYAKQAGVDSAKFEACLNSHASAADIAKNQQAGYLLGVQQTPTFFVDGRKIEGALPWPNLQNLIQYELKRPAEFVAGGQ